MTVRLPAAITLALALAAVMAGPAASAGAAPAPGTRSTEGAPAVPTPFVRPGQVDRCWHASMRCIDATIELMEDLEARLGCDHRAVFATTYLLLTREVRRVLRARPDYFDHLAGFIYIDVVFANFYFRTIADDEAGRAVPEAWRIAFDTARSGDANGAQDMLLGINAHVQRDMPYVLAKVGLHNRKGESRKGDHDRMNEVLAMAYERIVSRVAQRYDPLVATTNASWNPADDVIGLETVKSWREVVWRNAERLLNASTPAERDLVKASIEANAAASAREIAAVQGPPGYRFARDAHCRQHLR